jgi:Ni,Fe-hydrogenase maturation factor
MKVLVFGNPLLKQDSIPIKLLPKLKQKFPNIEFKEIDPTEDLDKQGKNLIILDTVQNIDKVTIINDIEKLHTNKIYSMHDFDLALNLKLLKKLNKINSVKIIGIPMDISEDEALNQITTKLK